MLINHGIDLGCLFSRTCLTVVSSTAACRDLVIAAQEPEIATQARGTRFIESKNVTWISGFVLIGSHVVPCSAVLCHESHVQSQLESFWSMFWYDLVLEQCCSWGDWCRSPQWLKCSQLLCGTRTTTRSKPRSRHWNLIHGSLRTCRSVISIMHCNSRRNLYKSSKCALLCLKSMIGHCFKVPWRFSWQHP